MTDNAPPARFSQTRTARFARARLARSLQGFEGDNAIWHKVQELVPEAWATVREDIDCEEPRIKITLRLDASVARFYRAMGKGYQNRINRILAAYAEMQIGEVERKKRELEKVFLEFGANLSDEARANYMLLRENLKEHDPEGLATTDIVFGVK